MPNIDIVIQWYCRDWDKYPFYANCTTVLIQTCDMKIIFDPGSDSELIK